MVRVAYYNPATGDVTATVKAATDAIPDGVAFVPIPPGVIVDDCCAWRVDLDTLQLVAVVVPVEKDQVNVERDRRIRAGFTFAGHVFDFDTESESNITGAGSSAGLFVAMGGDPQSLRWADPDADFVFLSSENAPVPMSAQACFDFSQAALRHKKAHIFKARAIKDLDPIPADFASDQYWT